MWTNYPENLLETLDTTKRGWVVNPSCSDRLWCVWLWWLIFSFQVFVFTFFFFFASTLNHSGSYLWGWNNIRSALLTVLQFPGSQNMVERPDLTLFLATQIVPRGRKGRSPLKNIIVNINNEIFRFGGSSCGVWIHRLRIKGWLQLLSWFHTSYLLFLKLYTVGWSSPSVSILKPTDSKLDPVCRQTPVWSCVSLGPCGSGIGLCCQIRVGSLLIPGLDPSIIHVLMLIPHKGECLAQNHRQWPDQPWYTLATAGSLIQSRSEPRVLAAPSGCLQRSTDLSFKS